MQAMVGIDYQAVRSLIPMADVLHWIGFTPTTHCGSQLRGPCPLPKCPSRTQRAFSVHLPKQLYHCFTCRNHGNQLDLWAAVHELNLYNAAVDLCQRAHTAVPRNGISTPKSSSLNTSSVSPRNQPTGPQ